MILNISMGKQLPSCSPMV